MANRFWVGGNGTWDLLSTSNWAATTGGASGASAPIAVDNVFFDVNSGSGTCTTAIGAVCASITSTSTTITLKLGANLTTTAPCTFTSGAINLDNNTLTCTTFISSNSNVRSIDFGSSGQIQITGNATTVLSMGVATNFTYAGTSNFNLTYAGSTGTRNIRFGGTEINAPSIAISAGSDAVNISTARTKNLIFSGFTGSADFGSTVIIYGNLIISSGMTLASGVNATTFAATSGTQQITTNGKTIDFPIIFNGIGGTFAFQDALTQGSTRAFTITNGTVQLKNGVTSTVGVFATSGTNQKFLQSTLAGSQATISQASGTVNASYLTIKDINATGGATWNALKNLDAKSLGNNSGWKFLPVNLNLVFNSVLNKILRPAFGYR